MDSLQVSGQFELSSRSQPLLFGCGFFQEMQKLQEESAKSTTAADNEQLRARYANFGISLANIDGATTLPHFINLDMDDFRNGAFMFILTKPEMVFGPKGDFRPQSLAVVPQHCTVTLSADGEVTITLECITSSANCIT